MILFVGTCDNTSNTTFVCLCPVGWEGKHCEKMVDFCKNATCLNKSVCRRSFRNYTCECLVEHYYSGPHCQMTAEKIKIFRMVSKSFAYISIIAMIIVTMFVIIMDVLKYCFGIDLTHEELERYRREKQAKKRKRPVIQRFVYVNAPPTQPLSTIVETTI